MQDLKNIQKQLAQEEKALLTARDQVRAAHQRIEEARGQITAIQAQIQSTQRKIQELESHAQSIEKRVALLRAYMEMAASSSTAEPPQPPARESATPSAAREKPKPKPHAPPTPAGEAEPPEPASEVPADRMPAQEDEIGDLEFGEPLAAPTTSDASAVADPEPITFETMDEEYFTLELLPRTSTFEEELILLMAFHRKAIKPKDIANRFKRLDYTPKTSTTEKNIKEQVETSHFFQYAGEGRVALSDEGRVEAQHLLDTLQ